MRRLRVGASKMSAGAPIVLANGLCERARSTLALSHVVEDARMEAMNAQRDFELYLMSLMRAHDRIDGAIASLGISREGFQCAVDRTSASVGFLDLVPHEGAAYRAILGAPIETMLEPGISSSSGFAGSVRERYRLQLWPELDLILRTHREGWVWGPELVRGLGKSAPLLRDLGDVQPWTVLCSEVVSAFGRPETLDEWNFGKDATYGAKRIGVAREVALVFDLELLQRVAVTSVPQ